MYKGKWHGLNTANTSTFFCQNQTKVTAKFILLKIRKTSAWVMGILSDDNSVIGHIFRIVVLEDNTCPFWNKKVEPTKHSLCECPIFGRIRHQISGADVIQLQPVTSHLLMEILGSINNLGYSNVKYNGPVQYEHSEATPLSHSRHNLGTRKNTLLTFWCCSLISP